MIFAGDVIIKTAIELGIDDMKKNPWLIDDMLSDMVENPYLRDKYGQKQIDACKEWLENNRINIYMRHRKDKDELPCVTIALGSSQEKSELKHMADSSTETVTLLPNTIGKPIPYVVKPFVPTSYDQDSGELTIGEDIKNTEAIAPGMILVNPNNGNGYVIKEVTTEGILLDPGLDLEGDSFGIVPQYQFYKARREHSFFQETYVIGCHAHGDPQTLLWLWAITKYAILRYKESLLEAGGFNEVVVSSGDLTEDPNFTTVGGEESYVRFIQITGQVENSWLKSPRRSIETIALREKKASGYTGGIKIISNSEPLTEVEEQDELWYPIDNE